jgi:hypothetical protein
MHDWRRTCSWRSLISNGGCALLSVIFCLPFIKENFLTDMTDYWQRSLGESNYGSNLSFLNDYSARPSDYFLPNVHNAFFGHYFHGFIADANTERNVWSDEFAIGIGLLPTLFLVYLVAIFAGKTLATTLPTMGRLSGQMSAPLRAAYRQSPGLINSLFLITIISFLISLPPHLTLFGQSLPMPNEWLRHLVPFRSYSRFALVFLVALSMLIALVVKQTRKPWLWVTVFIAACVIESFPKTMLHRAATTTPYIAYLRSRPEQVIMRFEQQNVRSKRALDLELMLTNKLTINGDINYMLGYTELPITPGFPHFHIGQLGQLGAELLITTGHLQVPPSERPYLELLAAFPEDDVEIWKIIPTTDTRLTNLFQPFIDHRRADPCYVAPKTEVLAALQQFWQIIKE